MAMVVVGAVFLYVVVGICVAVAVGVLVGQGYFAPEPAELGLMAILWPVTVLALLAAGPIWVAGMVVEAILDWLEGGGYRR